LLRPHESPGSDRGSADTRDGLRAAGLLLRAGREHRLRRRHARHPDRDGERLDGLARPSRAHPQRGLSRQSHRREPPRAAGVRRRAAGGHLHAGLRGRLLVLMGVGCSCASPAVLCASVAIALAGGVPDVASGAGADAGAGAGSPPPAGEASAHAPAVLSNFRTLSRWAYPQAAAAARLWPSPRAHVVGRLHFLTEDGQEEVYLALRSDTAGGRSWIEVALPGRPNGAVGWVPADALGELHSVRDYLRVNREALRATFFRGGHAIWSAQIGVGRPALPTPAGHFYVREKLRAIGGAFYGPFALGTSAYAPHLTEWPGGG